MIVTARKKLFLKALQEIPRINQGRFDS